MPLSLFSRQIEHKATPSIASNAGISGIGRLIVASHSQGRLVCSIDDTLTAVGTDAPLTVFPYLGEKDDHSLTQGVYCFEITVVSIGAGVAIAGYELSNVLRRISRGQGASACVSLSDNAQPGDIFRFIFDVSEGKLVVLHKKTQSDETNTIVVHCKQESGVRSFCPFVTFQSPFSLRLNLGHRPFSSAFIENQVPGLHSFAFHIRKAKEKSVVQTADVFKRCRFCNRGIPFTGSLSIRFGVLNTLSGMESVKISPRTNGHEWTFSVDSGFPTVFLDGILLTAGRWCACDAGRFLALLTEIKFRYYEVTILGTGYATQFGWCDL